MADFVTLAVGGAIGFVSAVLAEPVRRWIYRPKLKLTFEHNPSFEYPESGSEVVPGEYGYVRVAVTNKRRTVAEKCRVYLTEVEYLEDGVLISNRHFQSTQLGWSGPADDRFSAIDIPKGVTFFADVLQISAEIDPHSKTEIQLGYAELVVPKYSPVKELLYPSGTYRLTILVTGQWVKQGTTKLRFEWTRDEPVKFQVDVSNQFLWSSLRLKNSKVSIKTVVSGQAKQAD